MQSVTWENIYKPAIVVKHLHSFSRHFEAILNHKIPIFVEYDCTAASSILGENDPTSTDDAFWATEGGTYYGAIYYEPWDLWIPLTPSLNYGTKPGTDSEGNLVWAFDGRNYNEIQRLFYIHPTSGEAIVFFEGKFQDDDNQDFMKNDWQSRVNFLKQEHIPDFDVPQSISLQDSQIGYLYTHYSDNSRNNETRFKPICSIPSEISDWSDDSLGGLSLQRVLRTSSTDANNTGQASAVFSEKYSNAKFLCEIPSAFKYTNDNTSGTSAGSDNPYWQNLNYWNINSLSDDEAYYSQGLHVAIAENEKFFVFRSELFPKIFDFHAEVERSYLS